MSGRVSGSLQFQRAIHRGLRTLGREGRVFSSMLAVAAVLSLLGALLLGFLAVRTAGDVLRANATLQLQMERGADPAQVEALHRALLDLPGVSSAVLTTKDQAYQVIRRQDPSVVSFIDTFGLQNPFPDSIGVTLESADAYPETMALLQDARWQGVVAPEFVAAAAARQAQLSEVLQVARAAGDATVGIVGVAAAVLLLALASLLHRRVLQRSADTQTQMLLGAAPSDIFVPLWTEAVVILFGGLVLAAAALAGLVFALPTLLPGAMQSPFVEAVALSLQPALLELWPWVLGIALAAVPVLAALSAAFGLTSQGNFGFLNRSHA
jgi:cell division protein FtsX